MPISVRKTSKRGFTLIEILVVVAVIALMTTVAVPTIETIFRQNVKNSILRMAGLARYVYGEAVLKRKTYRIVIDLTDQQYWAEYSLKDVYLVSPEEEAEKKLAEEQGKEDSKDTNNPDAFQMDEKKFAKPMKLPSGVIFTDVMKEGGGKPFTGGKIYIHFFPNGFAERAIIHLREEKSECGAYSLVLKTITGQMQIYEGYVESFK